MEFIEVSAKTVNEAITEACQKLGVTSDKLEYEVVEEGSTGFLGIGAKPAVIKATVKVEEASLEDVFLELTSVFVRLQEHSLDFVRVYVLYLLSQVGFFRASQASLKLGETI